MKKVFIVVGIVICLAAFTKNDSHALIVGDEIMIGESYTALSFTRFQLGGVVEFVLERELDPDTGTSTIDFEGNRFLFKPTISLFDNVDLYAKIGLGSDKLEDSNNNVKVESETGPAYGGGLRVSLINWDDIGVHMGVDAQFLRFNTGIDNVNIGSTNFDSASGDFTVDQWQIAGFISKEFFQATFYSGAYYADSTVKYDYDTSGNTGNNKGKNEDNIGLLGGVNIHITDIVIFFAEGHCIDEASLSAGLNVRF